MNENLNQIELTPEDYSLMSQFGIDSETYKSWIELRDKALDSGLSLNESPDFQVLCASIARKFPFQRNSKQAEFQKMVSSLNSYGDCRIPTYFFANFFFSAAIAKGYVCRIYASLTQLLHPALRIYPKDFVNQQRPPFDQNKSGTGINFDFSETVNVTYVFAQRNENFISEEINVAIAFHDLVLNLARLKEARVNFDIGSVRGNPLFVKFRGSVVSWISSDEMERLSNLAIEMVSKNESGVKVCEDPASKYKRMDNLIIDDLRYLEISNKKIPLLTLQRKLIPYSDKISYREEQ